MLVKTILLFLILFLGFYGDLFYEYPIYIDPLNIGEKDLHILREVRLPRVLISFLAGASLALAGLLVQGSTRNPLSSPSVLGINTTSSFFVCMFLAISDGSSGFSLLSVSLIGSFIGVLFLFTMGKLVDFKKFPTRLILVGVCLGMMMGSLTNLVIILDENNTQSLVYWLLGGVDGKEWKDIFIILFPLLLGLIGSFFLAKPIESLKLGDEMSLSLGHRPQMIRIFSISLSVLLVSSVVSTCGPLSFLGLIVPHLSRKIFGERFLYLLPLGSFFGGTFLVYADWFSRYIQFPYETPVGIISGLIGGGYFLYLSLKDGAAHA